MDISTTTSTSTTDVVNTISAPSVSTSSSNPNQFTDGDLAICTLLMVIITMQVLGASWKTLIGIKNKYPVYD